MSCFLSFLIILVPVFLLIVLLLLVLLFVAPRFVLFFSYVHVVVPYPLLLSGFGFFLIFPFSFSSAATV